MSLGDYFRPQPPIVCPVNGAPVAEWVGFVGPGRWLVFEEGTRLAVERRIPTADGDARSEQDPGGPPLPDGVHSIFGEAFGVHCLAHIRVRGGVWVETELIDADGGEPVVVAGPFRLWRVPGARFCLSPSRPNVGQVVPASLTAIGYNDGCIVAVRRQNTRDPRCADEWYAADVAAAEVIGPHSTDSELAVYLKGRGLVEPEMMQLPEDVRE